MAHEIGHWMLHPDMIYHRDRPMKDGAPAEERRSRVEREADLYAAELLMPPKAINERFNGTFKCERIKTTEINFTAAGWLSAGTDRRLNEIDLASSPRRLSLALAQTRSFGFTHFKPLCEAFGVSPTAMAIQLEQLGLVS